MKILHIITRLISGGADENTIISCNGQADAGHEVHLLVGKTVAPRMVALIDRRVTLHPISSLVHQISPANDLRAFFAIRALALQIRPDIAHTHTSKAGIIGRLAAATARVPLIVHGVHILPFLSAAPPSRQIYLGLERIASRFTDAFIHVSPAMRDSCIQYGIGAGALHFVVPSGMNLEGFRDALPFNDTELQTILSLNRNEAAQIQVLIMVAALEPRKRVFEFLAAFSKVRAKCPYARLVILGEGPEHGRILEQIRELGLQGAVFLLGYSTDVARWLATAKICALASMREGLPRVVIQYVLAGKPVIATALPGIETIVKQGWNGYVVGLDEVPQMAAHIIELLGNPSQLRCQGENSKSLDLSEWSSASMINAIQAAYDATLLEKSNTQHSSSDTH